MLRNVKYKIIKSILSNKKIIKSSKKKIPCMNYELQFSLNSLNLLDIIENFIITVS